MKWPSWIRDAQANRQQHEQRTRRAAALRGVKLVCARNLWDTLDLWQISSGHRPSEWVRPESVLRSGHDLVEVPLSGANVAALLQLTRRRIADTRQPEQQAMANRVYDQIAQAVDAVDADADPDAVLPPIVLDDELSGAAVG
ncbi:hypothetical protein [Nocardia sp. NPDC048505]|uniref:hypothetical protein n=1 Tax=unclassified Nocardia TaxID=2637762 RepID=UPI00340595B0